MPRTRALVLLLALVCGSASAADPVTFSKPLWQFGGEEQWEIESGKNAALEVQDGALALRLETVDARDDVQVQEKKIRQNVFLRDVNQLEITVSFEGGEGYELGINLYDEQNEGFTLMPRKLTPGLNRIAWSVPKDIVWSWGMFGKKSANNKQVDGALRLMNLFVKRPASAPEARIVFQGASGILPVADHVLRGLDTGDPLRILRPGREKECALVLANPSDQQINVKIDGRIESFDSSVVPLTVQRVLQARETARLPLPAEAFRSQGIKWLDYHLRVNDMPVRSRRESFAYQNPAGPAPKPTGQEGFWFVMHQDFWRCWEPIDEIGIQITALSGCNAIRGGLGWNRVNSRQGEYDWSVYDRFVSLCEQQELEIFAPLWDPPSWAVRVQEKPKGVDYWSRLAPRADAFREWVTTLAKHFDGRVRLWELSNEPDYGGFFHGTADELLECQQVAYEALKSVSPDNIVMTSGFAKPKSPAKFLKDKGHIHEYIVQNGQASFDFHNVHLHGPFSEFHQDVDGELARIRGFLKEPRPLWFGETAQPARGGLRSSEKEQATELVKKLTFGWARGAVGYTWFRIWDQKDWNSASDWQDMYWGLYTSDIQPKAVFCAHVALTERLRGKQFVRQLDVGPGRWGFVFADEQEQVVVSWVQDEGLNDADYTISADGLTAATSYDIMGNARQLPILNDLTLLPMTNAPSYLVLKSKQATRLGPPIVTMQGALLAVAGQDAPLQCLVHNPLEQPIRLKLSWVTPNGVQVQDVPDQVELAPGVESTIPLRLTVSAAVVGDDSVLPLRLRYDLDGTDFSGTLAVPVTLGQRIPQGPIAERTPDFVLNRHEQVMNENEFMVGADVEAKKWQGPDDLSAEIWLGSDQENLLLRVRVRDDKHCPEQDENLWAGDSIRYILQNREAAYRGWWEFGMACGPDNKVRLATWSHDFYASDRAHKDFAATATPGAGFVLYEIRMPLASLRMSQEDLQKGLRFNLQVNDRDLDVREGWIQLANGIEGAGVKDSSGFPLVVFSNP